MTEEETDYTSDIRQVEYTFPGWFSCEVIGAEDIVQQKKKVTFYLVKTTVGNRSFVVKRRFSAWVDLHNQLTERGKQLPKFPPKTLSSDLKEEKKTGTAEAVAGVY